MLKKINVFLLLSYLLSFSTSENKKGNLLLICLSNENNSWTRIRKKMNADQQPWKTSKKELRINEDIQKGLERNVGLVF